MSICVIWEIIILDKGRMMIYKGEENTYGTMELSIEEIGFRIKETVMVSFSMFQQVIILDSGSMIIIKE